jgi:hypothetical protein
MNIEPRQYYSRKDLRKDFNISVSSIKRYERCGDLIATPVGPRIIRYSAADVEAFLAKWKKKDLPDADKS